MALPVNDNGHDIFCLKNLKKNNKKCFKVQKGLWIQIIGLQTVFEDYRSSEKFRNFFELQKALKLK